MCNQARRRSSNTLTSLYLQTTQFKRCSRTQKMDTLILKQVSYKAMITEFKWPTLSVCERVCVRELMGWL